jgi:outer membrane receptor protein involved in Fe transport
VVGQPRWRRGFADIGYRKQARRNWDMSFNVTYTRNTFSVTEFPSIDRDSHEVLGEWTNFVKPSDRDQLTFGALLSHIQGSELYTAVSPRMTISDGGRPGGGVYAQWDHKLFDHLRLLGGVQANKTRKTALDFVPRAGIIWSLSTRVTVKALYGQAFRAPSINETMLNHPGLAGNPNLRPEKVKTADLSVGYQGKRIQAALSGFNSVQTDSIVVETDVPRMKYANLGNATFRGVEAEAKYYLHKNFLLLGSALYQTNQDGSGIANVTPVPNYQVKGGASYEVENGVTASLFDAYQGPLDPRYNGAFSPSAESYHLLGAHFRFDLSRRLGLDGRRGVALFAHAENLANRQIWLPALGDYAGATMPVSRGRTVYFGIEVWFRQE